MGEDAEKVPMAAASPPTSTVAAAVPAVGTDAGGPNDGVSATTEGKLPAEAAQNPVGEAASADPREEAVTASPKINDATDSASPALLSGTATGASFEGAAARADPMAVDSVQHNAAGAPQEQPTVAPIHAPTNGQSARTAVEDAMDLEQQNGDRDGGKNTGDSADDVVVDLLDSDDDEEVPTSATGKQPQVGDIPLPAAPPAAPVEGVAVPPPAAGGGGDYSYSDESDIEIVGTTAAPAPPPQQQHRAGPVVASGTPAGGAVAARADALPLWMKNAAAEALAAGIQLGSEECTSLMLIRKRQNDKREAVDKLKKRLSDLQHVLRGSCDRVQKLADDGKCPRADLSHVDNVPGHIPTWEFPIPEQKRAPQRQRYVPNAIKASAFKLSLLSCSDFTITPIQRPDEWNGPRGSLAGLRIHIKKAAKPYGGAKFERADDDGNDNDDRNGDSTEGVAPVGPAGRWRIPLGAYGGLVGHLATLVDEQGRRSYIEEIPIRNLQMATLGRELKNKAYPSARALIDEGIPSGIAKALAPYQRGGVNFALHQDGRVLIADEMGLGKTIQAIAAMSAYATEWPLIVFSPSSARYHWQVEFQHWLGEDSVINKQASGDDGVDNNVVAAEFTSISRDETDGDAKMSSFDEKKDDDDDDELAANPETLSSDSPAQRKRAKSPVQPMHLLRKSQVNVLTSSKDPLFPTADTLVVICSYGLAPNLIESGKIKKGMFKCAIVDESHMLKNKSTKRSRTIVPILMRTTRCIMLSGTPALSRPMELWPQLSVLGHERGWWSDESDFIKKYVNREEETEGGGSALAELHTLLTSTVMIRRMKVDMLKNLPKKERHNARIRVTDEALKDELNRSMAILREGRGALGKLARDHKKECDERKEAAAAVDANSNAPTVGEDPNASLQTIDIEVVRAEAENTRLLNVRNIQQHLASQFQNDPFLRSQPQLLPNFFQQRYDQEVARFNQEHEHFLSTVKVGSIHNNCRIVDKAAEEEARKTILNHLYSLTGKAKVGHVVKMLNAWLDDPTKGKLCIFAHHIDILDEITKGAGLSNAAGSLRKYIRIDGKTNPKARQEQMMLFQSDPTVRIAILGITAAGVAITLTAASTVWFAELFWTPAIMVQAEDRCHRIGQQATVKCLYIIAKGTLDEVLWKLIEKKFRQLGEFVEGKENLDIVVHRTFDCGLQAIAIDDDVDDEEEEGDDDDDAEEGGGEEDDVDGPKRKRVKRQRMSSFGDLADEDAIQHDIEELAKEEEAMLNVGLDDDDDCDASGETNNKSTKSSEGGRVGGRNAAPEKKKAAVICLDDSDDEAEACKKKSGEGNSTSSNADKNDKAATNANAKNSSAPNTAASANSSVPTIADSITAIIKSGDIRNGIIDRRARFGNLKLYSVRYFGPHFGLSMLIFAGRIVVKSSANVPSIPPEHNEKPAPGDFVVSVDQTNAPWTCPLQQVLNFMKQAVAKARGNGISIVFGHDSEFSRFFQDAYLPALDQENEEEYKRVGEELAALAASDPTTVTEIEPETETLAGVVNAPLPGLPAPAPVPNVQPEQDEVIELLDD